MTDHSEYHLDDLTLAQNIVQDIIKVRKILKLYPSNNPIYIKAVQEALDRFGDFFEIHDELPFKIHQNDITFNDDQVYTNPQREDNLALFFFKDGIREVTFLKGLTSDELENFVRILNTDFENVALDDDIVTLLWEKEFEFIRYMADDSFLFDESDEEIEQTCDNVKEKLYSDEDLHKAYNDGLQTVERTEITPVPLTEEDYKYIAKEIVKDESIPKVDKVITIVFELLQQIADKSQLQDVVSFIEDVILYCVKEGDFRRASLTLNRLRSFFNAKEANDERVRLAKKIFTTINNETFISTLGNVFDSTTVKIDEDELVAYSKHLDKTSIPHLLQLVGTLKTIKGRRYIINILSVIGRGNIELIAKGLRDKQWFVVRNTVIVLGKIGDERAAEYLGKTLSHSEQRVRKEAIKALGEIGGRRILPHLKFSLDDKDQSVRLSAVKALGNMKQEDAKLIIQHELKKKEFSSKDFEERKQFYEALANWDDQDVRDFLLAILKKTPFWNWKRKRHDEARACAAHALGIIGETDAIPLLRNTVTSKNRLLRTHSEIAIKRLSD